MKNYGTLTFWNDAKGYGFIDPDSDGERTFVHINAFPDTRQRPKKGDRLQYTPAIDKQGRPFAKNASRPGETPMRTLATPSWSAIAIAALAFAVVAVAVLTKRTPLFVLGIYAVVSIMTFFAYRRDKYAAQNEKWRIPESALHVLAICGGWPGALIAQQRYRHKTAKTSFKIGYWITVIINCALFGALAVLTK